MKRTCLISLLVAVSIAIVVIIFITIFITHGCDNCKTGKPELHLTGPVVKEWIARYHGDTVVYPKDMAIDSESNVYIWGKDSGVRLMLFKYNKDGKLLWVDSEDKLGASQKVAADGAGNIYVTGNTNRSGG